MVRRGVASGGRRRKSRDALTSRPEVERLLDAATAPASPRELAGESAAVALFARARLVGSTAVAATSSGTSRAGLKAAAASVAAVVAMSSGVAFAASGHVPFSGPLKNLGRAVTGQAADTEPSTSGHDPSRGTSASPNGPKSAALVGLCQAFQRGQKETHGHALEAHPFRVLVAAAGGKDQVADFCASLPPKSQTDASHPAHPAHPSTPAHPTHPTHPAHPTHPTHPTTGPSTDPTDPGTQPTHPTHPSHPTQPTHTPKPSHATHNVA